MFWWEHLPKHWCRTCSLQRSIVQSVCWLNWTALFTDDKSGVVAESSNIKKKKTLVIGPWVKMNLPQIHVHHHLFYNITKRRPVVSAGHKGRLPGETRSACKGKRGGTVTPHRVWTQDHLYQESVLSCPLTLRWYLIHVQTFFFCRTGSRGGSHWTDMSSSTSKTKRWVRPGLVHKTRYFTFTWL